MKLTKRISNFFRIKSLKKKKENYGETITQKLLEITGVEIINGGVIPVKISIDKITLSIYAMEEVLILQELFVNKDYYFSNSNRNIFIDIGMNVGFTSLYAANTNSISNVYSFEPVNSTYIGAKQNFRLNEKLSKKIRAFNFGLGKKDETREFLYSKEFKGSVGMRGLKSWNIANASDRRTIKAEIKEATSILQPILLNHPKEFIVCKMDCEGAEYEIIPNLVDSELIKEIDLFIIEYHDDGYDTLEKLLIREDFLCLIKPTNVHLGIIYAFNKTCKVK